MTKGKRLSREAYRVSRLMRAVKGKDTKKIVEILESEGYNMTKGAKEMVKEQLRTKKHKHKWSWDKSYGANYCKICGRWDRS